MYEYEGLGLIKKYNELQKIIYRVVSDYRDDEFVDDIDRLEWAEEEFGQEFLDFLLKIFDREE